MGKMELSEYQHKPMKIALLGTSLGNPNRGVGALSEASIKCILNRWPEAEIILLLAGINKNKYYLKIKKAG